jgi:phosphoserine phosphatase RsbU/P
MDVGMPGVDGIEATRRIMATAPTPVVMLTAFSDPEVVQEALDAGAAGYLVKPILQEQLGPTLTLAVAQSAASGGADGGEEAARAARRERELLRDAEREASEARARARKLQEELRHERELARVLVGSFLTEPPEVRGLEVAHCFEAATEFELVGGDFVDFLFLPDGRLAFAMGDLCGHGVETIPHAARTKFMLRGYALEDPEPAGVVGRLNRAAVHQLEERCPFLSLFYGILDCERWALAYCNAGHPPPILWDPAAGGPINLEPTGGLVGVVPEMNYAQASVPLPPGAVLAVFTDGVTEARTGTALLGQAGVEEVLREHGRQPAARIAEAIRDRACEHAGGRLTDDLSALVLRRVAR